MFLFYFLLCGQNLIDEKIKGFTFKRNRKNKLKNTIYKTSLL